MVCGMNDEHPALGYSIYGELAGKLPSVCPRPFMEKERISQSAAGETAQRVTATTTARDLA